MDSPRACPLCDLVVIPSYRAMCAACFDRVPWKPRALMLQAHRLRVEHPFFYRDTLARTKELMRESVEPARREWKGHFRAAN